MLTNIPAILSPELLAVLCEMGHSDVIVLGDANFPGKRFARMRETASFCARTASPARRYWTRCSA